MNDAFARLVERDGNFIEQFQTTGFNMRTFELYVSELLHSEGFEAVGREPQPDFTVRKNGIQISIECTTVNPTGNDTGLLPYKTMNPNDLDVADIRSRQEDQLPIRIAGALRSKMQHRLDKKNAGGKAYWELPHVAGHPFVLAIQTFHEHGSLSFSNVGVIRYLYGLKHTPTWDKEGNLIVQADRVEGHKHDEKEIPSGFFDLPGSENVSAVLWTNAGMRSVAQRVKGRSPLPKTYYDTRAEALLLEYETVTFDEVHSDVVGLLKDRTGSALDVGCGSGRDAAWLAAKGWNVVAADPSPAMLDGARRLHPDRRIEWLCDGLPGLGHVKALERKFDFVLISAVWMHVPETAWAESVDTLAGLLAANAIVNLSIRTGPDADRDFHTTDLGALVANFAAVGMFAINDISEPDKLGRAGVSWRKFTLRGDGRTASFQSAR